jgi:hypothetical protein
MSFQYSEFIYCADNALSEHFCKTCIEKFEADERKFEGHIGHGYINKEIKDSTDLTISSLSDWKYEDNIFCETLSEHLKNYVNSGIIKERTGIDDIEIFQTKMEDTGYQIQRTNPNSGYTWHSDFHTYKSQIENTGVRLLTFIWYLNDIVEDGYTEFIDGTKIQPKTGRMIIFPACWTFYHRGYPPKSETKYIATGWLHSIIED